MEVFRAKLPVLIKHYRVKNGYTQSQIAEKLDTSLRSYQRFESGEAEPSLSQIHLLSKELQFNLSELFYYQNSLTDEQRVISEADRLVSQALSVAHVGLFEVSPRDKRTTATNQIAQIFDLDSETSFSLEMFADNIVEYPLRQKFQEQITNAIENVQGFSGLFKVRTQAGVEKILDIKVEPRLVEKNIVKVLGSIIDVTQYKALEEKLSQALYSLSEMCHLAGFGVWELDLRSNYLKWTDSLYEIFEIDKRQFAASYEGFLKLVHPEDRDKVNHAYLTSINGQKYYEVEHRLLMPDGRVKWMLEKCVNQFSPDGKAINSKGYAFDITRWKNQE